MFAETHTWSDGFQQSYLLEGNQKIEMRWTKSITLKGGYFKNKITFTSKNDLSYQGQVLITQPSYFI